MQVSLWVEMHLEYFYAFYQANLCCSQNISLICVRFLVAPRYLEYKPQSQTSHIQTMLSLSCGSQCDLLFLSSFILMCHTWNKVKSHYFLVMGCHDVSYTSIILSCISNETNILRVFDPYHEWDYLVHFTCYGLKSCWEGGSSDWF